MKKILNAEYGGIHATYWMAYAVITSFASAFLLDRGYSNSEIGLILAVGSVVAVFMQPFMADIADRSKRISLIGVTQIVTALIAVLMLFCFIMQKASIALSVVFVMMIAWHTALQPLFNSLAFKLEESGYTINFGVTRAMGSLAYSILCSFLGTLAEKYGTQVLPITGELVLVMLFITLCLVSVHFKKACAENKGSQLRGAESADGCTAPEEAVIPEEDINLLQFIKRNKLFLVVNVGVAGIFFSNAIFNSFMLQIVENVGGNGEDMGRILSIMAFLEIPPMFLFAKVNKKFSCKTLLQFGAVCFTLKILFAYLAKSVAMVYFAQLFQLGAFGIFLPAMVSFIDEIMDKGEAVKGQALYTIVTTVASIFSSLVGGMILDIRGATAMLLVSTVITAVGALIFICVIGKVKSKKTTAQAA